MRQISVSCWRGVSPAPPASSSPLQAAQDIGAKGPGLLDCRAWLAEAGVRFGT
jgi:hypothetical protein